VRGLEYDGAEPHGGAVAPSGQRGVLRARFEAAGGSEKQNYPNLTGYVTDAAQTLADSGRVDLLPTPARRTQARLSA